MRPADTAMAGGTDEFSETDEELFARARAHMEKHWGAASLGRRLWDATVRLALRASPPEAEQRDAARYRWIRDTAKGQAAGGDDHGDAIIYLALRENENGAWLSGPTNLDYAIDALYRSEEK